MEKSGECSPKEDGQCRNGEAADNDVSVDRDEVPLMIPVINLGVRADRDEYYKPRHVNGWRPTFCDIEGSVSATGRRVDDMLINSVYWGRSARVVSKQLEKGADANIHNESGQSALMIAAAKRNFNAVQVLLEHGADVNAVSPDGITPLMWAVRGNDDESVHKILQYGALVNAQDVKGRTAAMFAMKCDGPCKRVIIDMLADRGCDMNMVDCTGATPLMWYTRMCHQDSLEDTIHIASRLLKSSDVNAKDESGNTILMTFCEDRGWDDHCMMGLLLDSGAEINASNDNGVTALMNAATAMTYADVVFLLDRGADVHAKDSKGNTALDKINFGVSSICTPQVFSAQVLLYAGASVELGRIQHVPMLMEAWKMREEAKLSLKGQCRKAIRSCIATSWPKRDPNELVEELGLPAPLSTYVGISPYAS